MDPRLKRRLLKAVTVVVVVLGALFIAKDVAETVLLGMAVRHVQREQARQAMTPLPSPREAPYGAGF